MDRCVCSHCWLISPPLLLVLFCLFCFCLFETSSACTQTHSVVNDGLDFGSPLSTRWVLRTDQHHHVWFMWHPHPGLNAGLLECPACASLAEPNHWCALGASRELSICSQPFLAVLMHPLHGGRVKSPAFLRRNSTHPLRSQEGNKLLFSADSFWQQAQLQDLSSVFAVPLTLLQREWKMKQHWQPLVKCYHSTNTYPLFSKQQKLSLKIRLQKADQREGSGRKGTCYQA